MPSCYVVQYSRVQVTPTSFLIKKICTPMMFRFFLYVLCVAVQMISRSLVQRVNLYAIPQLLPILLPFGVYSLTSVPNVFDSSIQLCS